MTIDSNIVIAYLAGDKKVVELLSSWKQEGRTLFLPAVAEAEILSFSEWSLREKREVETFLEENFTSIAFDRTIARISADIRGRVRIKLPDAAIAAVAIFTRTPLVTRNQRDFKKISGLNIITL